MKAAHFFMAKTEEIVLEKHSINGCILSDQVKNLDWTLKETLIL